LLRYAAKAVGIVASFGRFKRSIPGNDCSHRAAQDNRPSAKDTLNHR